MFALGNAAGTPIIDAEAQTLASTCKVQVFFTGGDPVPNCATYDMTTDTFIFKLKTSKDLPSGLYALTVKVFAGTAAVNTESVQINLRR